MKIHPAWLILLLATSLSNVTSSHADGVIDRLLGFLGISASPSQMKGAADAIDSGEIWIVPLAGGSATQIERGANYRWPVFAPGGEIALLGEWSHPAIQLKARCLSTSPPELAACDLPRRVR